MTGETSAASLRTRRRRSGPIAILAAVALVLSGCSLIPIALMNALQDDGGHAEVPPPTPDQPVRPDGFDGDFGTQVPSWEPCGRELECADLLAPLDWEDPDGDIITLRLVKQPAQGRTKLGTLFVNPGGPGASGADFIIDSIDHAVGEPLQERFDVIGWDPRGVGASSAVECLTGAEMDEYLFGLSAIDHLDEGSPEWIAAATDESAAFGRSCLEHTGPLLAHVDTASTVHDLDMMREVVGDDTLNFLGYSYGTYIGARYADRYPDRVGRLVLDGAIDPAASLADVVREQTLGFEAALRTYASDCITRRECPLTGPVDHALEQIHALLEQVERRPITASDGRELGTGTFLTAIITPLYSKANWPFLDELFAEVGAGHADTAMFLADFYHNRVGPGEYEDNSSSAFTAINCLDYPNDPDPEQMRAEAEELERLAPTIGKYQGYGDVGCAGWPIEPVSERGPVTAAGAEPILVIGTTGDPATPYRWAEDLAEQLDSGVLVTYEGEGHTAYGENACINETVESYFLTGAVPERDPLCTAR